MIVQKTEPAWTRQHIKQDSKTSLWRAWCDCGWERTDLNLLEDKFSIVRAFHDHEREGCSDDNAR